MPQLPWRRKTSNKSSASDQQPRSRTNTTKKRRPLTLPSASQGQSLFFVKLPAEIREHIIRLVLCPGRLSFFGAYHQVWFYADPAASGVGVNHQICNPSREPKVLHKSRLDFSRLQTGLIHLPRTCRQMYSEAIPLIYQGNTFCFEDMETFLDFQTALPRARLMSIRSLDLKLHLPHFLSSAGHRKLDEELWIETCQIISEMEGLAKLKITVTAVDFSLMDPNLPPISTPKSSAVLLDPLMKVTQPGHFEVSVSWFVPQGSVPQSAPFSLVSGPQPETK